MVKKKKKPLLPPPSMKKDDTKLRPWFARSDKELVKERYDKFKDAYDSTKVKVSDGDREQLIEEAARRDPRIQNLLDMVIHKREGLKRKDGFLLFPIYGGERGEKIARFLKLRTTRRIRLDEYGWAVWYLIDDKKNVREIGRKLEMRFGEKIKPTYPRLSKFMAYLQNLKLIEIKSRE